MYKYKPHSGRFYSDIGNGKDQHHVDFVAIFPDEIGRGVIILKSYTELVAYDFDELLENKKDAKVLNYKNLSTPDLAYSKFMKWIGKMIKKGISIDEKHVGRYYSNTADEDYEKPMFVSDEELMKPVYEWMNNHK